MKNIELTKPSRMSGVTRVGEITAILAAAIIRTITGEDQKQREICLGFMPDQRVHTTSYQPENLS
ncbi:hypothetical protein [Ferrovum sp.]|uniref:hypothetical protein n=1 Tax=Ferrovum sp. TaxID=2609467 RepID=UPI002639D4ED|nr:hypothetical protein [Ferrovum sp.]